MSTSRKNKVIKTIHAGPRVALLYCRVSSDRQASEGHGLDSQEHRCREYATSKGYKVERVFRDSVSGGGDFMVRPAMSDLIKYLDDRPFTQYVIIFDDLKRFARDTQFHIKLRTALKARDAKPECLNFNFEDTPEGEFIETILAAQGQLERQQNKRQVSQKMKARLDSGYWTFFPPPGYDHPKDSLHGKLLTPNSKAEIIREAFEGFASGRFREQVDVQKFLRSKNMQGNRPVYLEYVKRLLSRVVYAGYIEYEPWGVARRMGHHQAIISIETFEKAQEKLGGRHYSRSVDNEDFPLRGLVACLKCQRSMTAGWSKGRNKSYPYYKCQKTCVSYYGKDVRKERIEKEFHELLQKCTPKQEVIRLTEAIFKDALNRRLNNQKSVFEGYNRQQVALEKEKGEVVDKIVKTQNEAVMRALEGKVQTIDSEILRIEENKKKKIDPEKYGTALDVVFGIIKKPAVAWENGNYKGKRLVTKLVCTKNPVYDRIEGYGTTEMSDGIKLFELVQANGSLDVEMGGIEPPCRRCSGKSLLCVEDFCLF